MKTSTGEKTVLLVGDRVCFSFSGGTMEFTRGIETILADNNDSRVSRVWVANLVINQSDATNLALIIGMSHSLKVKIVEANEQRVIFEFIGW